MAGGAQALVQTNYTVRVSAFLFCFAATGIGLAVYVAHLIALGF